MEADREANAAEMTDQQEAEELEKEEEALAEESIGWPLAATQLIQVGNREPRERWLRAR